MKTLVLYESKYGNTEKIAEKISQAIGASIHNVAEFKPEMLTDADFLIVGSPIHGWQPSAETAQFLSHLEVGSLEGKFVAAFDTGFKNIFSGNAAARIMKKLEKAGGKPVGQTQKFVVMQAEGPLAPGEMERAETWAIHLKIECLRFAQPAGHTVS